MPKPKILTLVGYDNPVLRKVAEPVLFPLSKEDQQLISDMKYSILPEQLKSANATWDSAAGMAANQWGIGKRIFLFGLEGDGEQFEVIINPEYEAIKSAEEELQWEACFSVPLATGCVSRSTHIRVSYQNERGEIIKKELEGWPARIWQHENDHLNGILYDDKRAQKCQDKRVFKSKEEVENFYSKIREDRKINKKA